MAKEKPFEKIWIDLREFGWGIRQVPVIWPEDKETLGPDTVGTEEIKDGGVDYDDLSTEVQEKLNKSVDREQLEAAVDGAVATAVADKADIGAVAVLGDKVGDVD